MVDSRSEPVEPIAAKARAGREPVPGADDLPALAARLAAGLQLDRPLTFVDLETTGLDVRTDRIVEVAVVRVEPSGSASTFTTLINPRLSIPPAASRVHGITDNEVADAPAFVDVAGKVWGWLAESDLGGYNLAHFDLPMLQAEFDRAGHVTDWATVRIVDACAVFKRMERRDLAAAYRFYCAAELDAAHSAVADVRTTMEVLLGQLEHYPELPREVAALDAIWRPRAASESDI